MKLIKEHINFERGLDPKVAMGVGDPWKNTIDIVDKIVKRYGYKKIPLKDIDVDQNIVDHYFVQRWEKPDKDWIPRWIILESEESHEDSSNHTFYWISWGRKTKMIDEHLDTFLSQPTTYTWFSEDQLVESYKFERGLNPKEAMGLSIYEKRNFDSWDELTFFIWQNITAIAEVKKAKDTLYVGEKNYLFKPEIWDKINDYITEYVTLKNSRIDFGLIDGVVYDLIKNEKTNESLNFERGVNPKKAMGIGIEPEIEEFLKENKIGTISSLNPSALMAQCARFGKLDFVRYCCEKLKADPKWDNCWGFRWAAENGHLDVVKYLFENYDININASRGWALRFAADGGHLNVVKYLLEHGAMDYEGQANKWAKTQEIKDLLKQYSQKYK